MEKDTVVSELGLGSSCLLIEYLRDEGGEVEAGYCREYFTLVDVHMYRCRVGEGVYLPGYYEGVLF
jgi:hypothetical protein